MTIGDGRIHVYYYKGYMYVYVKQKDVFFGNICWVADYLKVYGTDDEDVKKQFEKIVDMMQKDCE